MGTSMRCPPEFSSPPTIISLEKKCTCCLLHPTASKSSPCFSSSLVVDLIRMGVVGPPKILFQVHSSSRKTDSKKKWSEWVKAMACNKTFIQKWNQAGINDAILVASIATDIRIDQQTVEALFGFWCSVTNTFIFPWGEAAFTPEDVHVLTALPLRGSHLDQKLTADQQELKNRLIVESEKILVLSKEAQRMGMVTSDIWLDWFINEDNIDDELRHLGFLTYWLCKDVFPSENQTLASLFGVAVRLSLGDRISLAPALVANIYHDLNIITESIVSNHRKKDKGSGGIFKASPSFGFLQCWIWERFETLRPITSDLKFQQRVRISRWSGSQIKTQYNKALEIFEDERSFTWRPYSCRLHNWVEPEWYNMESRVVTIEAEKTPAYVYDFLSLISCTSLKGLSFDGRVFSEKYHPDRFARQFGFDQSIPGDFQNFNYLSNSIVGVQLCIPGITKHGNLRIEYIKWWKTYRKSYKETLREKFMPKGAMEKGLDEVGKNGNMENHKAVLTDKNIDTSKKRKAEELEKHRSVIKQEHRKTHTPQFYSDKELNVINIDSDDEENKIVCDAAPSGFPRESKTHSNEKNELGLVKELEDFQHLGLMTYEELNPEIEESNNVASTKCEDPYGQEAIEHYPNFFRHIPQNPHYKELLKGKKIAEDVKKQIFLGQWYMLVDLMKEALRTNDKTIAAEVERLLEKARMLEKNGFNVRHLIARLKLVHRKH
ncbi:uncharacterized protein A4U43_C03F31860 [Asparagus officinalis]|uniref:Aminotransferase-like plant mobile domain-containing protein n=1 Tax=Asparagus officinalis TaxID=4686 RepID=A0A5P1FJD5_ASPOF|nr:uncharacterized protein LOC109835768 [Asparagus officinalis]XP_020259371.1 uncharacterized protein LOC109835768 [Asparagus officinalis]XP_020259372.1 uncharacterized protein LOC109835768 [Asparagus officinalis]ONK76761.1 uncharacterized protein A4U43_C03F31860 [Asparagus officinalis]